MLLGDYLAHSCRNAHCSPCHIRYATCSGLPDGINVWRGREKTPFYVVCQAQRVAFHGRCINPEPGKRQIYDGEYHTCGRPVDFEMGMVHHMHRGEIGKSQIVKQINHAKRVGKAEKRPKASMGKNNPAQQSGNQQKALQASKPHINQPKANQASPQNTNNNNQPPQNKPNTPQPHVNQPNNNMQQQTPSSSSNNAANSQNSQHSPHVNQPKTAAPQSNTQTPPGPANQQTKAPVPSTPHANQPSAHANQPAAQANQPPVQANQPPAHVNQPPAHANQPPAHVNQPSAQANKPPAHANQPQSHAHAQQPPSQQNNYQPPQQQQYGPPAQGPPPNYGPPNNQPRAPQPHPNVAPQPHVNKPHTPVQHQRTPYAQPHSQPQAQKPNSLQSFIGEIQSKGRYQQPHPNRPVQYPNQPQSNTNAPLQVVRAKPGKRPPLPYMNSVPSVPRVPSVPSVPQSQPRNPIPRQHHIQQQPPPYSHPNQQRQPSYPHVPQPLPPVQQRPPAPVVAGPVHNGPSPAHHPNMPQTIQRPNTQPSYPQQPYAIPNRQHIAPQPAPQQRMYPQPVPRAPSHGPQPIQPRPVGPYPQPQLYNEPATIRQSISPKQNVNNISQKRYPVPTTQVSRVFQHNPYWREVVVQDAKREKIADLKSNQTPAQQSIQSKSDRAMERYSSHILGLNEVYEKNANAAQRAKDTLQQLQLHKQNEHTSSHNQQQHHINQPNYHQHNKQTNTQQQSQNQVNTQNINHTPQQNTQQQSHLSLNSARQQQGQSHNNHGLHPNQPMQQSQLSNLAQHQQFQQRAMQQIMGVNPTQAYTNPRLQTHQSAVGSSLYLQTPMPTVLSNYLPASTARTALLNSRFTIQSGVAASRLSQGSGHTFSQSLSNPSQFALTNVA